MSRVISPVRFLLLVAALTVLGPAAPTEAPAALAQEAEDSEEELETFIPTEKLPADSAISFPVDI